MILLGYTQALPAAGGGLFPDPDLFPSPGLFPDSPAGTAQILGATSWGVQFDVSEVVAFSKGSAFLDGGGGLVDAVVCMGIWSGGDFGALVAVSDPTVVSVGAAPSWVDFTFPTLVGHSLALGAYTIAIFALSGNAARLLEVAPSLVSPVLAAGCTFVQGLTPADLTTAPDWSNTTTGHPLFLTAFATWTPPDADDFYLGRLAWEASQRAFGVSGNLPRASVASHAGVAVGWHGVNFDVETGAFGLARKGGALEDLVGQRILVVRRRGAYQRLAAVFLYAVRVFPSEVASEDLSLTRRAFLAISGWEQDEVEADIFPLEVHSVA